MSLDAAVRAVQPANQLEVCFLFEKLKPNRGHKGIHMFCNMFFFLSCHQLPLNVTRRVFKMSLRYGGNKAFRILRVLRPQQDRQRQNKTSQIKLKLAASEWAYQHPPSTLCVTETCALAVTGTIVQFLNF